MEYKIIDESGDKDYYTMVPNYVLNHSDAVTKAVYLDMKRVAGEHGRCFMTEETMCKRNNIGLKKLHKAIDYLLEHKWIEYIGKTPAKTRPIKTYKILDIWKLNTDFYSKEKIPSKREVSKDTIQKNSKIPSESMGIIRTNNTKEEPINIYSHIFEVWNHQGIIKHRSLTDKMKRKINGLISDKYTEEEIISSIRNYGEILNGNGYYFKYKWTLQDFLQRGFEKFLDLETAKQNYSEGNRFNGKYQSNNKPSEGKYDKFNVLEKA